jgi:hypothetical protein
MNTIQKITAAIMMMTTIVSGQIKTNLDISSYYDDNLYHSPEAVKDWLTDMDIRLSYIPKESPFTFYYDGNLFMYTENSPRNFMLNSVGLNFVKPFGPDEIHTAYMGGDWTLRSNGEDYIIYNYYQLTAYANLNFDLDFLFLKTGYNLRYRRYENIPELTNTLHTGFVQVNKSFPTRTTFILEGGLGYKSFAGQDAYSSTGRGYGRGYSQMYSVPDTSSADPISLSQAVLLARVSQSLHDKIGIFVQYRRQFSLTDQTDYLNSDQYFQDEELFDDPYSFESKGYSTQLTWMMPWSVKLQLGGGWTSKDYISEQAYLSAEDSVGLGGSRKDTYRNQFVTLSKTIAVNKNWLTSLQLNLNYIYIRNTSNSYWYDYKNNMIGGGLQWNF